jgi:hypothetical protein
MYDIISREITIHTIIHGAYIRFWPTLVVHIVMRAFSWRMGGEMCNSKHIGRQKSLSRNV